VTEFNFADSYRAAGLTLGPDVLRARQEPFDELRKAIDAQTAIDLTRIYFGLPVPRGTDWFRDVFGATDPSFSLVDNAREASVLAGGLLEGAAVDGKMYAALATLTTAAGGLRQPLVRPELIDLMRATIRERAVSTRQHAPVDAKCIKTPTASKLSAQLTALTQGAELIKASALLKEVSEESVEITEALANQVFAVVQPLAAQVLTLREEVEMLWWYVGGWSRLLDKPFMELDLGLAAVLAGVDMAEMSRSATGPAAAPAIFQRILVAGRKAKSTNVAIKDAVDALPQDQLDRLKLPDVLATVPEICPVLTAFAKANAIGTSPAWHMAYAKATELEAGAAFAPLELAVQSFRERLLLQALV
jgi:hypothetical protein